MAAESLPTDGPPLAPTTAEPLAAAGGRSMAIAYLVGFVAIELAAARSHAAWGLAGHGVILISLLVLAAHSIFGAADGEGAREVAGGAGHDLLVVLALASVVRILSFALPLDALTPPLRYAAAAGPALVAVVAAARANRYRPAEIGLRLRWRWSGLPLDLAVGVAGLGVGYLQYRLLAPTPLIEPGAAPRRLLAVAVALVTAAFVQELVLRGVVLRAAAGSFGAAVGVLFAAAVGAAFAVGGGPSATAGALLIGIGAGAAARRSGSLLGTTLAHALAAIGALLLFPRLLGLG